jgi:hypothetical protein
MKMKIFTKIGFVALVLFSLMHSMLVFADVPTVVSLEVEKKDGSEVLLIEIRHSSPSSSHYVDIIDVEIGGELEKISDIDPQTESIFVEEFDLGSGAGEVNVRVHCNVHGWSKWVSLEQKDGDDITNGGGIPGFPLEALALGFIVSFLILWMGLHAR